MKADHLSYAILPAERDTNHMVPLSPFSIFRRAGGSGAGQRFVIRWTSRGISKR